MMVLATCLVMVSVTLGQMNLAEESAVQDVLRQFVAARNAKDVTAVAGIFAENADFATSRGEQTSGRESIVERFAKSFKSAAYSKSLLEQGPATVRVLTADCALADFNWKLTGLCGPDGKELPARSGHATAVLVKTNGKWLVSAFRAMVPAKD